MTGPTPPAAEPFLVRAATTPLEAILAFAAPELIDALEATDRARTDRDDRAEGIAALLHRAVPHAADRDVRRALLAAKRAVHAGRPAELPGPAADWIDGAMPELAADLTQWQRLCRHAAACGARSDAAAVARDRRNRATMKTLARRDAIEVAVRLSGRELSRRLDEFQRATDDEIERQKPLRHFEASLMTYCYRSAAKVSPFSSFTATGSGTVGDTCAGFATDAAFAYGSVFGTDLTTADRIHHDLLRDWATGLPLVVNRSAAERDGQIVFIAAANGDGDTVRATDAPTALHERQSFRGMRIGVALRAVLDRLAADPDGCDGETLARHLVDALGQRVGIDDARAFLSGLTAAGLLMVSSPYCSNSPRPLIDLARLQARRTDEADTLHGRADAAQAACDALASASTGARLADAEARLVDTAAAMASRDPTPSRRALLHHDCRLDAPFQLGRTALAGVLGDLRACLGLYCLFDATLATKALLHAYHRTRFGDAASGLPLTIYLRDFYRDVYHREFSANEQRIVWDPFLDRAPELTPVAETRRSFIDALLAEIADGSERVALSEALVAQFGAAGRGWWRSALPAGVAFFGHLTGGAGDYGFVVNQAVSAYGTYLARYADDRSFGPGGRRLYDDLRDRLRGLAGAAELVELTATFGQVVQVHRPLTDRQLAYPGDYAVPPDGGALRWADIGVAYDAAAGAPVLADVASGRRIYPLRSGPLAPHLMPPIYRIIAAFGPLLVPDMNLLQLFERRRAETGGLDQRIRVYPRITLGQVVLMRRSWRVPPGPDWPPVDADGAFMAVRNWAARHQLPLRVFVTALEVGDFLEAGVAVANFKRAYKPFFVSFDDPWSVRVLARLLKGRDHTFTMTEMLPDGDDQILRRNGQAHVSELLLEVYDEAVA